METSHRDNSRKVSKHQHYEGIAEMLKCRLLSNSTISICCLLLLTATNHANAKPIQQFQKAKQDLNTELTAYSGEPVLNIQKQESMKNAFGKADIFGKKVDKGTINVLIHNIEDKTVHFIIEDDTIHTNETVMSHTQIATGTSSGTANTQFSGNSATTNMNSSGTATRIGGTDVETQLSSNQRMVIVDTSKQPRLIVGDFKIVFIEVDGYLKYRIEEN